MAYGTLNNKVPATNILGDMPDAQLATLEELLNRHSRDVYRITRNPEQADIRLETTSVFAQWRGVYTWTQDYLIERDGSFSAEHLHEEEVSELLDTFILEDDSDPFVPIFKRGDSE